MPPPSSNVAGRLDSGGATNTVAVASPSVVPNTRAVSPPNQRRSTTTPSNTMTVSYRPMLSQKAKRHVVTITDALVRSSGDDLISSAMKDDGIAGPSGNEDEMMSAALVTSSSTPQRRFPVRSAQTPPPSLHRTQVPDASWTGGVLRSQSANLDEALDEDYLSEVPTAIASPMPIRGAPYVASSIFELRKATPVVTGFDRLDNAIMRLVHRLPESTLEDKFQLISRWIDSYHVDVVPRKLATQLGLLLGVGEEYNGGGGVGDVLLDEASAGGLQRGNNQSGALTVGSSVFGDSSSGSAENSTTLKSIISSAFSLHQLMLVLVKHKPVLGPVAMRTLQAVYNAMYITRNPLSTMPPELMDFTASRQALLETLKHFQHRTYFQETRDSQRRMAAVQEFTARYEVVKKRQLSSVKRQIDSKAIMWQRVCFSVWKGEVRRGKAERQQHTALISLRADHERALETDSYARRHGDQFKAIMWQRVCFSVWKGEVRRGKAERQQHTALISLRADHERALERIRTLEDTVAKRDTTITELRETIKTLQQRAELAQAAFKYDMLHNTNEVTKLNTSLSDLTSRFVESQATCNALCETLEKNRLALQHQLKQLDDNLWMAQSFQRASETWKSVDGPVTSENACKFLRMLACRTIDKHRESWEDPPPPPSPQLSIRGVGGSFTLGSQLSELRSGSGGGVVDDQEHDGTGITRVASATGGFDVDLEIAAATIGAVKNSSQLSEVMPHANATLISNDGVAAGSILANSAIVATTPTPPPAPTHSALHTLCERYLKERTSITIPHGHDLINLLALAMLDLYDVADGATASLSTIVWNDVMSQCLQSGVLQQKVQCVMKWCRSDTRFPFGPVLHEFFLEEETSLVSQAVALEFLQLAISPLRRLSSFKDLARDALSAPSKVAFKPQDNSVNHPREEVTGQEEDITTLAQQQQETAAPVTLSPAAQLRVDTLRHSVEVLNPLVDLHERLKSFAEGSQVASACDVLLASQIGPRLSWGLLSAATRQLTVAETADRAAFQVTSKDLQSVPTIAPEDDAMVKSIQSIVTVHVLFLRHAFMFYAGFESGNAVSATLSDFGLVKMMRDARIGVAGAVDVAVVKALAGDGLSPKRFVTALTHIAVLRFSQCSSPSDALGCLIWRLRATLNTQSMDSLVLSPLRDQWVFNRMIDDIRPEIMKVFRRYATESAAGSRITTAEVAKMLQELKLSDDQLTAPEVQESFTLLGAVQGGLVFDQFVQLLFVLGTLRLRAPWLNRTARVTRFVYDLILTPLQKKAQLTVVSL
ncbi:Hypothetical protein, putative [Bodo saltans]|uniref:Uncharacterized protein n=1 Tax=Bodo saltans TaxID=75058 RepID=A0A0S4IZ26_BODSA|nr:Hypothetical protein, putative [Bodo saltans]|eukprot:CUG58261.1 Hypothetical protein, putative [Bodo saltans]